MPIQHRDAGSAQLYLDPNTGRPWHGRQSLETARRAAATARRPGGQAYIPARDQERLIAFLPAISQRLLAFATVEAGRPRSVNVDRPDQAPLPAPASLREETAAFSVCQRSRNATGKSGSRSFHPHLLGGGCVCCVDVGGFVQFRWVGLAVYWVALHFGWVVYRYFSFAMIKTLLVFLYAEYLLQFSILVVACHRFWIGFRGVVLC